MKISKGLIIAATMLIVGGGAGYYYWTGTPKYSLLQIKSAIDNHNTPLFNKHVDVESVVSRAVDVAMEHALNEASTSNTSGAEDFGASLVAGMIVLMKPKIIQYATNKIEMVIEGGPSTESHLTTAEKPLAGIDSFFDGTGGLEQVYLRKEDYIAYLGLERFDDKLQDTLTLEFKLRKLDGYWQVIEISNLKEMYVRTEELKAKRLTEINAPIHKRLKASITVNGAAKKNVQVNRWEQKVALGMLVTNNTGEPLKNLVVQCDLLDDQGNVLWTSNLSTPELPVVEQKKLQWEFDINRYKSEDMALLAIPDGQLQYAIQVQSLTLPSGETIAPIMAL